MAHRKTLSPRSQGGKTLASTPAEHDQAALNAMQEFAADVGLARMELRYGHCPRATNALLAARFHQGTMASNLTAAGHAPQAIRQYTELRRRYEQARRATIACYATMPPSSLPKSAQLVIVDQILENSRDQILLEAAQRHALRLRRTRHKE